MSYYQFSFYGSYYFKGNEFTYIDFCSKIEIRNIIKKKNKRLSNIKFFSCLDNTTFRHITRQIMDLTLIGNENKSTRRSKYYTTDVYEFILIFFKNLKYLTIVPSTTFCFIR